VKQELFKFTIINQLHYFLKDLDAEILTNDFGLKKEYSLELMEGITRYLQMKY